MRESPVKWAIGTGIAALALVVGIIQWLFPQGAGGTDPGGQPPASASASPRPKSDLERTPMIGYEFWQNDVPALMKRGPDTPAYVTDVTLAAQPFEIRLPKPPGTEAVRIGAWSDDSIFSIPQGADFADHQQFGFGRGMANGKYFDGALYLDNQAMNYLVGDQLTELTAATAKIVVSRFGDTPIQQWSAPVYLTIFIDNNHNGRFDNTEYEYIILRFQPA